MNIDEAFMRMDPKIRAVYGLMVARKLPKYTDYFTNAKLDILYLRYDDIKNNVLVSKWILDL